MYNHKAFRKKELKCNFSLRGNDTTKIFHKKIAAKQCALNSLSKYVDKYIQLEKKRKEYPREGTNQPLYLSPAGPKSSSCKQAPTQHNNNNNNNNNNLHLYTFFISKLFTVTAPPSFSVAKLKTP
jgi:hypothetical protein